MKITFLPQNIIEEAKIGETVLEVAAKAGVNIDGNCNGAGNCGKCKVKIADEASTYVLACQTKATKDITVLTHESVDMGLRKTRMISLPKNFQPDLIRDGEGNTEILGLAVDMGTTTVVVMLWDLHKQQMIGTFAAANPQSSYGADVITRITFAMKSEENLHLLQKAMIDCINQAIDHFFSQGKIHRESITKMVAVGNTTMSHLFLGIDPSGLALAPFVPKAKGSTEWTAEELGININPQAIIHCVANIAGHVGSDITAGILTTDLMDCTKGHLFIDIGTNGEIVLTGKGKAVTCSTAAGPAFEGSSIKQGMRADSGAIERVKISASDIEISMIKDITPVGICGSGIIDAVGQLIKVGIIDHSGRIRSREMMRGKGLQQSVLDRIRESENGNEFVLYLGEKGQDDVVITQKDVREIQMAKAAISAGISVLMEEIGLTTQDLEKISIAGAFGNYINKNNAMGIGLFPEINPEKISFLGNSAGIGASMILLSSQVKCEADEITQRIEHIQLAEREIFSEAYLMAMNFNTK